MHRFLLPMDYLTDVLYLLRNKGDFEKAGRYFFRDLLIEKGKISLMDLLAEIKNSGMGIFKIVAYSDKYVIISGRSIFAKLMLKYHGLQEKPVDHFILGVLNEWGKERGLKFEEVECVAQGKDKCIFVGKPLEGSEDKT